MGATPGRESNGVIYRRPTSIVVPGICHSLTHTAADLPPSGG